MNVVVTGGAGFIGSRVVRSWVRDGAAVTVVDDLSGGSREAVPDEAALVVADVADPGIVRGLVAARPDVIIHAAAQVSVARSVADPELDRRINVDGTRHVIEAAEAHGARVVLLSSGGAVYGEADGATEDDMPAPESPYGEHKLEAERHVAAGGAPFAIARLANVYGPGQRAGLEGGVAAIFAERLSRREPITIHGTGAQVRDFVHVDDVVEALRRMAVSRLSGTWNVATGRATTVLDLLRALEAALGPAVAIRHEPRRAGDVTASRLAIDRIRRDLDWSPAIALEEGVRSLLPSPARAD